MATKYKCFVYVIQSGGKKNMPIKIGMSHNPDKRIKALQTGNPELLRTIAIIECRDRKHASLVEKTFHETLIDNNILGEWFSPKKGKVLKAILGMCERDNTNAMSSEYVKLANRTSTPRERSEARKSERLVKMVKSSEAKATVRIKEAKILRGLLISFGMSHSEINNAINLDKESK